MDDHQRFIVISGGPGSGMAQPLEYVDFIREELRSILP